MSIEPAAPSGACFERRMEYNVIRPIDRTPMPYSLETQLVHAGAPRPGVCGAVRTPIFQSATFEHDEHPLKYIRYNNTPNQQVLNRKLAVMEGAEAGLVTGSGMTAISSALLAVLSPGDHILVQDGSYGGTHAFVTQFLTEIGVSHDFIDADDATTWDAHLRPTTRAIYVESISNPLLRVADLESVVEFAQSNKLTSLIDNTFATPINYPAASCGFDLSLHSATKYMNGHSDVVAGAIIGRGNLVTKAGKKIHHLGGVLDPHACFLLDRGLQTMALRVRHQNASAAKLARFLDEHPATSRVNYPGLTTNLHHERAGRLFEGYGAMISFEPHGGVPAAKRIIDGLKLFIHAPSLGGVESLITRPSTSSHSKLTPSERARVGIRDDLVRISIGIEGIEDLQSDFENALAAVLSEVTA